MDFGKKGRIYILPTRFGFVFLAGALIMIMIGASYQNNLVNLLAYFMMSLVFISMIQTHNNLKDVRIDSVESEGGHQGTEFVLTTVLANGAQEPRQALETNLKGLVAKSNYENVHPLIGKSTLKLRAAYPALRRGLHPIGAIRISTVYPLGLFRSWTWLPVNDSYFVYPEIRGDRRFPVESDGGEASQQQISASGDDFHGHRKFSVGDSARRIDWKAHARGRPLLVKEFSGGANQAILLDWRNLEGLSTEDRLSQLAAWIVEARKRKLPFSLWLPTQSLPLSEGANHANRCLEALAVYEDQVGVK